MKTAETARPEDWKNKYFKALNELDDHERSWSEQITAVNRDLLRVLDTFRGHNPDFDRDLETARAGASHHDDERQRLLGRLAKQAALLDAGTGEAGENLHAAGSSVAPAAAPAAEPDATAALLALLDALVVPLQHAATVTALRDELGVTDRSAALDQVACVTRVAEQLSAMLSNAAGGNASDARDAIQTLLDHLSLPAAAQQRLSELAPQIEAANDDAEINRIAREIANQLAEYVETLHTEIAGLNDFLLVIKNRLEHVSEHVVRDNTDRENASRARDELDVAVRGRLDSMREEITETDDIEVLKNTIQIQIAELDGSVSGFLSNEAARLAVRAGNNAELAEQIVAMKKESDTLRRQLSEARARASHDALTGLPNRAAYNTRLRTEHASLVRHGKALSMAVIDLDKFKVINDTWGHQAGDRVLKHVARELKKQIRAQDFFARFGGEEFVLLLPDTALEGAMHLAEALRRHIDLCHFTYKNTAVNVTISCGVAEFGRDENPGTVFDRADAGLYAAKSNGRNRCEAIPA